ncbi:MAG: peroxiredoxin [Solirubrobacteraceae bacterium]
MPLALGTTAPDFQAETSIGPISFYDWIGDSWVVLFSHPKAYTPVCTTELGYVAKLEPEFKRRNVKVIGLSADTAEDNRNWTSDIQETQGTAVNYPIIGDADLKVSKLYEMLPAAADESGKRTAADNMTVRNVFIIGPDKKIKLILVYPMNVGRDFHEVLRTIDALQLSERYEVSTPAQWKPGEKVFISGSVSNEQAKERFGQWEEPKPYMRIIPQP